MSDPAGWPQAPLQHTGGTAPGEAALAPPLAALIDAARAVLAATSDPAAIVERLRQPVRDAALAPGWLGPHLLTTDPAQGFGSHLLHEDPGHDLALFAVAWAPGRGAPPHDHGTWGVVCGVRGCETNTRWQRTDDGSTPGHADLRRLDSFPLSPGDLVTVLPADIHSVQNATPEVSVSLHLYGRHLNWTKRSQYDPAAHAERPFVIRVA